MRFLVTEAAFSTGHLGEAEVALCDPGEELPPPEELRRLPGAFPALIQQTQGVAVLGNDEWTAEVRGATHLATYAYASGGAGLPNVQLTLTALG